MRLELNIISGADTLRQVVAEFLKQANPSGVLRVIACGFVDASESVQLSAEARLACQKLAGQILAESEIQLEREERVYDDSQLPHS